MTTTIERSPQPTRTELVDRAKNLQALLRKRLADSDIQRRQSDDVIEALTTAGFFRLNKPRSFGGYPIDLRTTLQITETLAEADGSAAWVVGLAATGAWATNRGSEQVHGRSSPIPTPGSQAAACPARPAAIKAACA
jgi:3-hydroxy-9,10-secoandrosta-1,3,5(10)-triene-9,17-dione monooxygenase